MFTASVRAKILDWIRLERTGPGPSGRDSRVRRRHASKHAPSVQTASPAPRKVATVVSHAPWCGAERHLHHRRPRPAASHGAVVNTITFRERLPPTEKFPRVTAGASARVGASPHGPANVAEERTAPECPRCHWLGGGVGGGLHDRVPAPAARPFPASFLPVRARRSQRDYSSCPETAAPHLV